MYNLGTSDGLFHAGNPLTGEKGTPIPVDFLNWLLQFIPPPPDTVNSYVLVCQAGVVAWARGGSGVVPPTVVDILANETYELPAFSSAMWGKIIVGGGSCNADFIINTFGTVQLVSVDSSGLIVANSDTAGKICLGGLFPFNPVVIANRTSGTISVLVSAFYQ